MRIVFVNLHGNEFLVKTLNKYIFKQSVAIKHKYFLDYLISRDDVEVCSFINKRVSAIVPIFGTSHHDEKEWYSS